MGLLGVLRPPGPAAAQVWAQVRALRRQLSQGAGGAPAQISMLSPDPPRTSDGTRFGDRVGADGIRS